ncbi:hypothetical protein [Haloarcula brevis]|uniref:hypothetical protein n=1 Tax=Haloarcula brevis TaxID=3111453 RepID=UPI00300EB3C1
MARFTDSTEVRWLVSTSLSHGLDVMDFEMIPCLLDLELEAATDRASTSIPLDDVGTNPFERNASTELISRSGRQLDEVSGSVTRLPTTREMC